MLNFIYLRLCLLILAVFVCDEIMEHSYLRADYSIDCSTDEHRNMVILAICMMLLYPIGIPLTFLCILNRRQREVSSVENSRFSNSKLRMVRQHVKQGLRKASVHTVTRLNSLVRRFSFDPFRRRPHSIDMERRTTEDDDRPPTRT